MPTYDALEARKQELIRKATKGSVFIAPMTADLITNLTEVNDITGQVELAALPEGYTDLGWLTSDGAQFSREITASDVTSWGSTSPTRTDITADNSSMTLSAQETNLVTLGLFTGAAVDSIVAAAETGEVSITKPDVPVKRRYRALSLAVDTNPETGNEIYLARLFSAAEITTFSEQSFGGGEDPILWGVTLGSRKDSDAGFAERWIFGGQGWLELLEDMGIEQEVETP